MEAIAIVFVLIILSVVLLGFAGLFGAGISLMMKGAFEGITNYFEGLYHHPLKGKTSVFMWLYAVFVAYFVFLPLFVDFAVAGASVRVNGDIINLRRMTNSLLGVSAILINLPLLPLLLRLKPLQADNPYLLTAQCLWRSIAFVIFLCCVLAVFMPLPALSAFVGKVFALLYFWWAAVMNWLDADNVQTINRFSRPIFLHDRIFIFDLCMLALSYLPFAFFRSSLFPQAETQNTPNLLKDSCEKTDMEPK
ncbi:hypothetical protein [Aggregatibacter kilianii]|uniref:hypothetical protein n=1 Tax=Aggregatibacter kilianii TaxID=2025884 RepID=UPI000D651541|nr:hypothetical protein [Aggregatibacter kilianii]